MFVFWFIYFVLVREMFIFDDDFVVLAMQKVNSFEEAIWGKLIEHLGFYSRVLALLLTCFEYIYKKKNKFIKSVYQSFLTAIFLLLKIAQCKKFLSTDQRFNRRQ